MDPMQHRANVQLQGLTIPIAFETQDGNLLVESVRAINPALEAVLTSVKSQVILALAIKGYIPEDGFEPIEQTWN